VENQVLRHEDGKLRCPWCGTDELYVSYHDREWGVPVHDDRRNFEFLILEGAQAGLSWRTILGRREGYRRAFADFDPAAVARFTEADQARLREDSGIIRNRKKIASAVTNAQRFLEVQQEYERFDAYIWRFVDGEPVVNAWRTMDEVPATTETSDALSKDLKSRGFSFVGSTIIYAHMQAIGLVNDHLIDCYRYQELTRA
jgi:DNA-3-methyladenine glycosylase I